MSEPLICQRVPLCQLKLALGDVNPVGLLLRSGVCVCVCAHDEGVCVVKVCERWPQLTADSAVVKGRDRGTGGGGKTYICFQLLDNELGHLATFPRACPFPPPSQPVLECAAMSHVGHGLCQPSDGGSLGAQGGMEQFVIQQARLARYCPTAKTEATPPHCSEQCRQTWPRLASLAALVTRRPTTSLPSTQWSE